MSDTREALRDVLQPSDDFLSRVRAIARRCGYAVAVHGSERRDLDLVAVPWTPEAISAQDLVETLCEEIPLHPQVANVYPNGLVTPNPEAKPWGRLAWSLVGNPSEHAYIDLSVAPRAGEAVPPHRFNAIPTSEVATDARE